MIRALLALLVLAPAAAHAGEPAKFASAQTSFGDRFLGERLKRTSLEPLAPAQDAKPALRSTVTVAGDIVRIGDLIENAGAAADVAIFRAPDLGQVGSVPAGRVLDVLAPYHFVSLDTRGIAEVVVTRASRAITFDNDVRPVYVEAAATGELHVGRLAFEPRSRRFDVTFDLPGSTAARRLPLRFTGSVNETFEALVLTRALAPGEVLKASDRKSGEA